MTITARCAPTSLATTVQLTTMWLGYLCTFTVDSRVGPGFLVITGYSHTMAPVHGWVHDAAVLDLELVTVPASEGDACCAEAVLC